VKIFREKGKELATSGLSNWTVNPAQRHYIGVLGASNVPKLQRWDYVHLPFVDLETTLMHLPFAETNATPSL
jgi:hypothetical protein